jgi:hypothetical protein
MSSEESEVIYKIGQTYSGGDYKLHESLSFNPSFLNEKQIPEFFILNGTPKISSTQFMFGAEVYRIIVQDSPATLKKPIDVLLDGKKIFQHKIGTTGIVIKKITATRNGPSGTVTSGTVDRYENTILLPPVSDKDLSSKPTPAGCNTGCSISGGKRRNKRTTKKARRTRRRSSK